MTDLDPLQAALATVRARFLSLLPGRKASVSQLLRALDEGRVSQDSLDEACAVLHLIAGTAQTLGFGALGDAARVGEEEIDAFRVTAGPSDNLSEKLREVLDLMAAAQDQAATSTAAFDAP